MNRRLERIAEAVHNAWWEEKIKQGVTDHPDMIPYEDLAENIKEYDRATAREVMKALDAEKMSRFDRALRITLALCGAYLGLVVLSACIHARYIDIPMASWIIFWCGLAILYAHEAITGRSI